MRIPVARRIVAATAALLAITAVAGCGDDAKKPAAASPAKTTDVKFGEYFYSPKKVQVSVGDSVRFVNVGKIEHTVADATKAGEIQSTIIQPRPLKTGQSQTVRFRKPGSVYYVCTFHPNLMRGVVVVG
jgi:plastocyanin